MYGFKARCELRQLHLNPCRISKPILFQAEMVVNIQKKRNKVCVGQVLKFSESELTADQFVYNSGSYRQTIKLPTMPPPWKETDGEISGLFDKPFFSFHSCHFTSG